MLHQPQQHPGATQPRKKTAERRDTTPPLSIPEKPALEMILLAGQTDRRASFLTEQVAGPMTGKVIAALGEYTILFALAGAVRRHVLLACLASPSVALPPSPELARLMTTEGEEALLERFLGAAPEGLVDALQRSGLQGRTEDYYQKLLQLLSGSPGKVAPLVRQLEFIRDADLDLLPLVAATGSTGRLCKRFGSAAEFEDFREDYRWLTGSQEVPPSVWKKLAREATPYSVLYEIYQNRRFLAGKKPLLSGKAFKYLATPNAAKKAGERLGVWIDFQISQAFQNTCQIYVFKDRVEGPLLVCIYHDGFGWVWNENRPGCMRRDADATPGHLVEELRKHGVRINGGGADFHTLLS